MINKPRQYYNDLICSALNVCGFSQLKQAIQGIKVKYTYENGDCLSKANILDVIALAYDQAFTPSNIKAGFHATGIHPFNPAVITAEKMAPSKATTKRNLFPGTMPMVIRKAVNFIMPHLSTLQTPCAQPAPPPGPQFHKDTTPLLPRSSHQLPLQAADVLHDTKVGFLYKTNAVTSSQDLPPKYSDLPPAGQLHPQCTKPLNFPFTYVYSVLILY